jgi:dTMP kinase
VIQRDPPRASHRGLLITFEGGEGSGKSTQVAGLARRLRAASRDVLIAREPGGTVVGERIRPLTRDPEVAGRYFMTLTGLPRWSSATPLAETLLFEAARSQLVSELVLPGLQSGAIIILDRFADSTLAYQGYGRGLRLDVVGQLNSIATQGITPDLTLLLDLEIEPALARKLGEIGRDTIGKEHREFHERVREGYRALAAAEPQRWVVLDGTLPPNELEERIWAIVEARIAALPDVGH